MDFYWTSMIIAVRVTCNKYTFLQHKLQPWLHSMQLDWERLREIFQPQRKWDIWLEWQHICLEYSTDRIVFFPFSWTMQTVWMEWKSWMVELKLERIDQHIIFIIIIAFDDIISVMENAYCMFIVCRRIPIVDSQQDWCKWNAMSKVEEIENATVMIGIEPIERWRQMIFNLNGKFLIKHI